MPRLFQIISPWSLDFLAYWVARTWLWSLARSRDFRRAALFGWIAPLLATRSNTLTAASTDAEAAAASPLAIAASAFLTKVRAEVMYGRFRTRRRSATRIRFSADLLFANLNRLSRDVNGIDGNCHGRMSRPILGW